jgi:3''-phosphoadenosine 5''-phosphosulfate sulfotransferase (PAPS reductase)/FAD synthetase and related enzymes
MGKSLLLSEQLAFSWGLPILSKETVESALNTQKVKLFPLDEYDKILVSTSGGKDSMAGLLYLLDQGVPKEKIELWHQAVDGKPGDSIPFADWPVTENYVRVMGEALGIKVRFQWREGGFLGELMRENRMSLGVGFETDSGNIFLPTTQGSISTRRKFPAKCASLRTRWCSSNLKIEVFARALSNYPEFKGSLENPLKILVFTGERREESAARSKYAETELHRCSTKSRIVHHWRSVLNFSEEDVWALIEKWRIVPHPAYILGWSRTSCCCLAADDVCVA